MVFRLAITSPEGESDVLTVDDFQRLGDVDGRGGLVIGSDPACDLVLRSAVVAGRHARYVAMGHHMYIEAIGGVVRVDMSYALEPSFDEAAIVEPGRRQRCDDFAFQVGGHTLRRQRDPLPVQEAPAVAPAAMPPARDTPTLPLQRPAPAPLPAADAVLTALITAVEQHPRRRTGRLRWILPPPELPPWVGPAALLRLLAALAEHEVSLVKVGRFRFADGQVGCELPTFVKGDMYGDVEVDREHSREDVLVIGAYEDAHLVLPRAGWELRDEPVLVDVGRGTEVHGMGTLAEMLRDEVGRTRAEDETTDLDAWLG